MFRFECLLQVGCIGINHKVAALAFREAMARAASTLAGEKARFFPYPIVLLPTCNRTEIYFSGADLAAIHGDLLQWLRGYMQQPFEHRMYSYFGIDCFVHLARVTAGLDSAIFAETEIQAQVKNIYEQARQLGPLPSCMHYVFQKALKIGKFIRNQMPTNRPPSLFQAVWQLAHEHLADIAKARILLLGYSEMNRGMIHFLRRRGREQFTLITQNPASVSLPGTVVLGYEAVAGWPLYDWIICASAHDRFLISGETKRRHAIFDLSVPRNVDPSIGEMEGIWLYNIEQIDDWIEEKKVRHTGQMALLDALVRQEAIRLASIFRLKNQYGQGISGTESHLVCFPSL